MENWIDKCRGTKLFYQGRIQCVFYCVFSFDQDLLKGKKKGKAMILNIYRSDLVVLSCAQYLCVIVKSAPVKINAMKPVVV